MTEKDSPNHKPKWRWAVDLLLILAVVLGIHAWQTRQMPAGAAPPLAGQLLSGEQKNLADYRGEPVLVHFWATWCPVCRATDGSIHDIARDYPVLTVASNSGSADEVRDYLLENKLDFPVLIDERGVDGLRWGVLGVPASFVIDGDGQIRSVAVGYTTEIGLRARLWLAQF